MAKHKHRDAIVLRPHHRKSFRVHHLGFLLFCFAVIIAVAVELGVVIGHDQAPSAPRPTISTINDQLIKVSSGYGFVLSTDGSTFNVAATSTNAPSVVTKAQLDKKLDLNYVSVRPRPGSLSGNNAASAFNIEVIPDKAKVDALKSLPQNAGLSDGQIAKQLFPVPSSPNLEVKTVSSSADVLNGATVHKTVYKYTAKQGGTSYTVVWTGTVSGRAYAVTLKGLVGGPTIPSAYASLFSSLKISSDQAVLGANTNIFASETTTFNGKLDSKYLSDAISPAVVQIYHTVCGVLTYGGQALSNSACVSMSGSGFLATQTGYIGTNGHVVVYSAKDALANLVISNDAILTSYLKAIGMNDQQIAATKSDTPALAAIISKIYDLSDNQLNFANKGELILVSLGKDIPNIQKLVFSVYFW